MASTRIVGASRPASCADGIPAPTLRGVLRSPVSRARELQWSQDGGGCDVGGGAAVRSHGRPMGPGEPRSGAWAWYRMVPPCHTWPSPEGPWSGSPTGCTGYGAAQIQVTYRCARLGYNSTRPRRRGSALIDPSRRWSRTPAPQCSNSRCRSVVKHGVPTYVYTADRCPTKTGSSCMACRPPAPGE